MKKVVSLLLVMLMVLGMSTVAFAAATQTGDLGRYYEFDGVGSAGIVGTQTIFDVEARPGDKIILPLNLNMFDTADANGNFAGAVTSTYISKNRISARIAIASSRQGIASVSLVYKTPNVGNYTVEVYDTVGGTFPADFAVIGADINASTLPSWAAIVTWLNSNRTTAAYVNELALFGSTPALSGSEWMYANTGSFALTGNKITYTFTNLVKTACIEVKFVRPFVSVDEANLDFTVYLLIDGKRQYDGEEIIQGKLKNYERDTFSDTTEFDGYLDQVAVAQEYAKEVKWDCDHGVFLYTKLFKGKKYYGICTREADERDDVVFAKYPDIDGVYNMLVVGLNSTTDYVRFESIGGDYYVYDKDLKYLGMSSDKLDFSSKYYISNKKLDLEGDDTYEEPDDEGDEPEDPPITGGNEYPSNVNDNPGTGR